MAEVRDLQDVGQFAASIEKLNAVLAIDPALPEANYRLGLALIQTGEPAAMRIRANANLAARRPEAALADTSRLVGLFPGDYGVRALHATVLGDLGRLEEAEREHQLLKEMGEESDDPAFASRACLAPAIFANDVLGDTEKAAALYGDCAAQKPTDTVAIKHLVGFFDSTGGTERGTALWRDAVKAGPDRLELHRGLAERLQALGHGEEAESVLRKAVERFDSAPAWNMLAAFYRVRSEPQQALEAIERVLELADDADERVHFIYADVLIDLGDLERAEEVAAELTQPVYAKLLRGRILLLRGEPAEALAEFEQGIRAWPNNAAARFLAGVAARDLGDTERAISEFREAVRANNAETDAALELARIHLELGHYQQAVTSSSMALRGRGGVQQPDPYVIAARAFTALGQPDRAHRSIKSLEERGFTREALRERMILERRLSGPRRAVELAERSGLDLSHPEQLLVLQQLVEVEIDAGEAASAVTRVERALEQDPDSPALLTLQGAALAAASRRADARRAYKHTLAIAPKNAEAHAGLASLDAEQGDMTTAIEGFDRAYALSPGEGRYAYSSAQLVLASGDSGDATRRLRYVVARHPGLVGARNDLAWLLAESGEELDFALELAGDASQRANASAEVLDTLGWVHYRRGEYLDAIEALERAVSRAPDAPSLRYRLGLALQKTGETARAREMFESALAAGSFPESEEARRQLSQLAGS
jgi:tetratricopeptide (TPR) repeat protein